MDTSELKLREELAEKIAQLRKEPLLLRFSSEVWCVFISNQRTPPKNPTKKPWSLGDLKGAHITTQAEKTPVKV